MAGIMDTRDTKHHQSMADEETFAETLASAKAGSEAAWATLYRRLAGPVTGYLGSRGATDPEDVAAETFLQVARNIAGFEGGEAAFRSWVFVIAHRRLIDMRRAKQRRPRIDTLPDDEPDPGGGDVEEEAIGNLMAAELITALDVLTEDQRDVLYLRIIGDLSVEDTALVIGKREGAVKALQRRALQALREHLAENRVSL
jgi:RNA polymerase sigma-70 factor (ECF subfamily)